MIKLSITEDHAAIQEALCAHLGAQPDAGRSLENSLGYKLIADRLGPHPRHGAQL